MKPARAKQKSGTKAFRIISRRVVKRHQVDESNITTSSHSDVKP